jgi:CheY-like chemotaxis protein/anti-sigma regulatory factor (Ser/Thr protein kinase)
MALPLSYRVVLADDVADMRFLLRKTLERSGRFSVVGEATNGAEAVAQATQQRPDLALLDLSMPVMDGLEALPRIRDAVPDCTVVVLSGFDTDAMADQALQAGAAAYLVKGMRPDDLVTQLLGHIRPPAPVVGPPPPAPPDAPGMMFTLAPELSSVRQARRLVQGVLRDWSREDVADEALLLTSELVTNAVVHARSEVQLTLVPLGSNIRVEVADTGPGALQLRDPDDDAVNGRGLLLVEEMSRTWGTSADDLRKTVWFEI